MILRLLKLWILAVLLSPWILVGRLHHTLYEGHLYRGGSNEIPPVVATTAGGSGNNMVRHGNGMQLTLASCQDLFGSHQIVRNGACLQHQLLQWLSCEISNGKDNHQRRQGVVRINPSFIQGSVGGETIDDVLFRPEEEEQLRFLKGSLLLYNNATIPPRLVNSVDVHMRRFLQSAVTVGTEASDSESSILSHKASRVDSAGEGFPSLNRHHDEDAITLLVRRGNYANPCMAVLTIYNVYIVLEHYYDYFSKRSMETSGRRPSSLNIIWLDGHAHGDLDPVWYRLFQTQPLHIKQLLMPSSLRSFRRANINTNSQFDQDIHRRDEGVMLSGHVMVVNTMSAIGDEGLGIYQWGGGDYSTTDERKHLLLPNAQVNGNRSCWKNSTLVFFRDFVLEQYGLNRTTTTERDESLSSSSPNPKILTLLVRQDYRAHPRSTGETDRTLANVSADATYLQTLYPSHSVQIVSFEGMPFVQQLQTIISTDVLVAVHGAGNIHVLFLPDHATLVEYIPKSFSNRRRFRFLAECLNVTYIAKRAWIEGRRRTPPLLQQSTMPPQVSGHERGGKELIQVRLRLQTAWEQENQDFQ